MRDGFGRVLAGQGVLRNYHEFSISGASLIKFLIDSVADDSRFLVWTLFQQV
jgi:hypothetical protein